MVIKKALLTCALLATPLYAVSVQDSLSLNRVDAARIPLSGENGCDFSGYRPVRIEQYNRKAVVKRVQPDYPPEAAKSGVQGRVSVKALINEEGFVEQACSIEGEETLRRAAEKAALQWKFKPGYGIAFLRPKTKLNPQNFAEAYIVFEFKLPHQSTSDRRKTEVLLKDSPSTNDPPKEASLIKRFTRRAVRLGRNVLGVLTPGESNSSPRRFENAPNAPAVNKPSQPPSAQETQPVVTVAVVPIYSPTALHTHTSGEVVIEVRINSEGSVVSVDAVSGSPLLAGGSRFVAQLWKFAPAANKVPIRTARLTFVYRLLPRGTPADGIRGVFKRPYRMEIESALPDERPLP